jgi:nifR3 family TIM-barrel protein
MVELRMVNFWLDLPKPFSVLAPMDDVTDNVFRQVVMEAARPDVFFTEFVNSDGLNHGANGSPWRKLQFTPGQHPIVAQIWGNVPESMEKAAKTVSKLGFDGIDINMGCPVKDVVKSGSGAGLIGNYELAGQIIKAVKKGAGKTPVSVKTRLGNKINISHEWIEFLLEQEICALTVHARTAVQMSKGNADWSEIGKIVKTRNKIAPNTIIIGNGDIKSYEEIGLMHKKYDVDGVMIGRGIFANPWVFDPTSPVLRGAGHSKEDYMKLLARHIDLFESTWGETKHFAVIKKFFKMYVKDFEGANTFRQQLMDTKSLVEMKKLISSIFIEQVN